MRPLCVYLGVMFATALAAVEPVALRLVADLQPGIDFSTPTGLFEWNGKVWFTACTTHEGREVASLYCTDGSTEGTRRIKDFSTAGSAFENPLVFEGRLYFQGPNEALGKGSRVWVTDGTEAGTRPISKDGQDVCDEAKPFLLGERLMLFVHGNHGKKHDLVALNLRTGVEEPIAVPLDGAEDYTDGHVNLGERELIPDEAGTSFWSVDGTHPGLKKLTLPGMPAMQGDDGVNQLVALPGGVLMLPAGMKQPWEFWHTDGSTVAKLTAWSWPKRHASDMWFGRVGGLGMLLAHDHARRTGLWCSDGTPQGTTALLDLDPYVDATFSFHEENHPEPVVVGEKLFFVMDDGMHGLELWCSDGTPKGTHLVRDLVPGSDDGDIRRLYTSSKSLVLIECRSENREYSIWITDGTEAGTRPLAALGKTSFSELTLFKNMLLMQADSDEFGRELWALDLPGTALGADAAKSEAK